MRVPFATGRWSTSRTTAVLLGIALRTSASLANACAHVDRKKVVRRRHRMEGSSGWQHE
jgi:hypothetical protein